MATFPQLRAYSLNKPMLNMTGLVRQDFIATSYPFDPILDPIPTQYDNHVYSTPGRSTLRVRSLRTYLVKTTLLRTRSTTMVMRCVKTCFATSVAYFLNM